MDRTERAGLGIALAAHVALFAALSLNLLKPPTLPPIENDPIEVALVDRFASEAAAPEPVAEAAAPPPGETVDEPADATPPLPAVQTKPTAKPRAETTKVQPEKSAPRKPGLSRDLVAHLLDAPNARGASTSTATGTPARTIGPAVVSSIGAEIRRQLKPHWKSPTGADVERLRTTLIVRLKRDGSLDGAPVLDTQTGVTESNRGQARLHVDQAIRAVRLAAPFQLPAEYYDAWKIIRPTFDKRLSQ